MKMKFPVFTTSGACPYDAVKIIEDFVEQVSREELFKAAEDYFEERIPLSSVYSFRESEYGLMGFVINVILNDTVGYVADSLVPDLMEHYGFTCESLPPRLLVREGISHQVSLNKILNDIISMTSLNRDIIGSSIIAAAVELDLPSDAYKLSNVVVDEVLVR